MFKKLGRQRRHFAPVSGGDSGRGRGNRGGGLKHHNSKTRKGGAIKAVVESEETVAALKSMGTDQEVRKDAARTRVERFSPASRIRLEGSPGGSPNAFV